MVSTRYQTAKIGLESRWPGHVQHQDRIGSEGQRGQGRQLPRTPRRASPGRRVGGGQGQDQREGAHDPQQHQQRRPGTPGPPRPRRPAGDVQAAGAAARSRPRRARRRRRPARGPGRPPRRSGPRPGAAAPRPTGAAAARRGTAGRRPRGPRAAAAARRPTARTPGREGHAGAAQAGGRCRPPAPAPAGPGAAAQAGDRGAQALPGAAPGCRRRPGTRAVASKRAQQVVGRVGHQLQAVGRGRAARRCRGESGRPESVTAGEPPAMAAPWSPKVCGTASRRSWSASDGVASERPPARATARSAKGASPADCRSVRPRIHTWTRSPWASPGAVEHDRRARAGTTRSGAGTSAVPALPTVLPSTETNRCGRWWRVVRRGPGQAQHHRRGAGAGRRRPAGVSRGARTRMPPAAAAPAVPGTTRYTFRRRHALAVRRAPPGPGSAPGPRPRAPARAAPAPSGRPGGRRRSPAGRSGAMAAELVRRAPASPARRWPRAAPARCPHPGSPG